MDERFAAGYYEAAPAGHWWFRGRAGLVAALLERSGLGEGAVVADVGGGGTSMFPSGCRVVRVDLIEPGCSDGNPLVLASGDRLPFRSNRLDGVGLFDVLEHTTSPGDLLSEARRVTRPGGVVLVTVPAHRWLWSRHDHLVGHLDRYTTDRVAGLLEAGGLQPRWVNYFYGFLLPAALGRRVTGSTSAFRIPPRPVNDLLAGVAAASARGALARRHRVGLSVGALAVRP